MKANFPQLEKKIGITFLDRDLLAQVFIHRSYLNEHPEFKLGHNERLEFLGDAVLELVVTEYLYETFPYPEGELTNLRSSIVRGAMLSKVAQELKLGEYLQLSKGEEKSGGKARDVILANTFEAFIGAIYLDHGYQTTEKFIKKFLLTHLKEIMDLKLYQDPKSTLQEWSQEKHGVTPRYEVLQEIGPDHNKQFIVGVYLDKTLLAQGEGSSKQKAQEQAAAQALNNQTKA